MWQCDKTPRKRKGASAIAGRRVSSHRVGMAAAGVALTGTEERNEEAARMQGGRDGITECGC